MLEAEYFSKIVKYLEHQRDRQLLRTLLSVKALAVEAFTEKLLMVSIKAENTIVIKEVLEDGIDPNLWNDSGRRTPLHYVATRGNIELIQALLDAGADVNA